MKIKVMLSIGVLLMFFNAQAYGLFELAQLMIRKAYWRAERLKTRRPRHMTPSQERVYKEFRKCLYKNRWDRDER